MTVLAALLLPGVGVDPRLRARALGRRRAPCRPRRRLRRRTHGPHRPTLDGARPILRVRRRVQPAVPFPPRPGCHRRRAARVPARAGRHRRPPRPRLADLPTSVRPPDCRHPLAARAASVRRRRCRRPAAAGRRPLPSHAAARRRCPPTALSSTPPVAAERGELQPRAHGRIAEARDFDLGAVSELDRRGHRRRLRRARADLGGAGARARGDDAPAAGRRGAARHRGVPAAARAGRRGRAVGARAIADGRARGVPRDVRTGVGDRRGAGCRSPALRARVGLGAAHEARDPRRSRSTRRSSRVAGARRGRSSRRRARRSRSRPRS